MLTRRMIHADIAFVSTLFVTVISAKQVVEQTSALPTLDCELFFSDKTCTFNLKRTNSSVC